MTRSALRAALYIIGGLLVAGGIALAVIGCFPPSAGLAGWGAILIIGLFIERWRYKPLAARSHGLEWTATGERFVDPETGKLVTVYFHPATGERRYVAS
jgi:quinol-cytochrome oxidoreductase complex cytochrome b subunit